MIIFKRNFLTPRRYPRFNRWLKDYLKNSSVAGCAYYFAPETRPKERFFWLLVHVTSMIFVFCMVVEATWDYTKTSTVTIEETRYYPVQDVDFPGIAICDVNKISYKNAVTVADELLEYDKVGNLTRREMIDMLKYLGHLYLFELNSGEARKIDLLDKLLKRRYKHYVPDVVNRLTSSCRQMLKYCSWQGKEQACEDMFFTRKTGDGNCCTFNYARPTDDFGGQTNDADAVSSGKVERSRAIGSQYGLTVLLRHDPNDDYYKILPVLGYKILIFSPMDFPDAPSGSLREILVSSRTETSLSLRPTTFYSVKEVSRYSLAQRNCLFEFEHSSNFGGHYSYSDCIMYCRIRDIIELCGCIPFFYPVPLNRNSQVRVCHLQDLGCLKKYRNRWWRIRPRMEKPMDPFDDTFPNLQSGVLNCSECLPACADVGYKVSVSSSPLNAGKLRLGKNLCEIDNFDNHSMVNIFYNHLGSIRLKQDAMFYWYELMSNFGGICSFFVGISLISIIELVYFFTLRLYKQKDDKEKGKEKEMEKEREKNSQFTFVKAAKPSLRPLYWQEMIQPNAKY